jgi:hypothetical protein
MIKSLSIVQHDNSHNLLQGLNSQRHQEHMHPRAGSGSSNKGSKYNIWQVEALKSTFKWFAIAAGIMVSLKIISPSKISLLD